MNIQTDIQRKTRINFILPACELTGGPLAIMEYASRLLEKGYDVSITTYPPFAWPEKWNKNSQPFPWFEFKGKYYYQTKPKEKKIVDEAVHNFVSMGGNPEIKKEMGLYNALNETAMLNYLIGCMPECDLNIGTLWLTAYAAYLSKKGKPIYFMQHYEEVFYPVDDSVLLNRLLARLSYQLPIYKVANSSWLQNLIYEKCNQIVPFSNNAIDLKDFSPSQKKSEKDGIIRVMTFSRPEEWKGFADVAEAMTEIHYEYGDRVEWHVFGREHNSIKPINSRASYILHTKLPFSDLAKLYAECDITICGSWYESFPLPPLESMASGTAVVTTLAGMEDYCINEVNCLAVKERDTNDIKNAIKRLIEDDKLRKRLAEEGLKTALRYDWDRAVNNREKILMDIYNNDISYDLWAPIRIGLTDGNDTPFEEMPEELRNLYPDGTLISFKGMIFLISQGCKHHIVKWEILDEIKRREFVHQDEIEVDGITFSRIPLGAPIRTQHDI